MTCLLSGFVAGGDAVSARSLGEGACAGAGSPANLAPLCMSTCEAWGSSKAVSETEAQQALEGKAAAGRLEPAVAW